MTAISRLVLCVWLLLRVVPAATAQPDDRQFKLISSLDGLGDNTVADIAQDSLGYIWIGTQNGMARYDGNILHNYIHTANKTSLPNSKVFRIVPLGGNKMAVLTDEGFQVRDIRTGEAKTYSVPDTTAWFLYCNKVFSLLPVQDSAYFISTNTGLYLFHANGKILWRYDAYTASDIGKSIRYGRELFKLPGNKILCFYNGYNHARIFDYANHTLEEVGNKHPDWPAALLECVYTNIAANGNDFFLSHFQSDSFFHYNASSKKITKSPIPPIVNIGLGWPARLFMVNDSLLVQTSGFGGFFYVHFNKATAALVMDTVRHLPGVVCRSVFTDNTGRLWLGTDYGLYMQRFITPVIKATSIKPFFVEPNVWPFVSDILRQGSDLYISGTRKKGFMVLDADTYGLKRQVTFPAGFPPEFNDVSVIFPFNTDTLWLGTDAGLGWYCKSTGQASIVRHHAKPVVSQQVNCIFEDSHGSIWIGPSNGSNMVRYERGSKKITEYRFGDSLHPYPMHGVKHIVEDAFGNIWVGDKGIARYNYKNDVWDTLINIFSGYRKFDDDVLAFAADRRNNLWIATPHNGLLRYGITNKEWEHFNAGNSLSSDMVMELSVPVPNKLFISTRLQLNIMDLDTKQVLVYNQKDGLPGKRMVSSFYYDSISRLVWAGYEDELVTIPTIVLSKQFLPPRLTVEQAAIMDDTTILFPQDRIDLSWRHPNISIYLTTFNFDDPEAGTLSFRLKPNEDWHQLESGSLIFLSELKTGEYHFEVKLHSKAVRWPDQVVGLKLVVHPPFWKTGWFLFFSCMVCALAIYLLLRKRLQQVRKMAAVDRQLADYELKALHAQMNPHFVFNCLGSIKQLVQHGENDTASRYLGKFARLIRSSLEHSTHSFITLAQNKEYLQVYIEMELLRFEKGFDYDIDMPEDYDADTIKIPPLMIQPLVENAIWHGLNNSPRHGKIIISFAVEGSKLTCTVDDNGPGLANSASALKLHKSMGIDNIRRRLELLNEKYGYSASLAIANKPDSPGVMVTLVLPLIE